jgi:hypothetical protein
MTKIKLVVTGDMEAKSLAVSLKSQFPTHKNGDMVIWDKARKMNCTTSHPLRRESDEPSQPMLNLARAMLAEALDGKHGTPADLVIVIDDVELGNLGQEDVISKHFRLAVEAELEKRELSAGTLDRYKGIIRERCSFHVLRPMAEAYFFSEAQVLEAMGVSAKPLLRHATNVEDFEAADSVWLPECYLQNQTQAKNGREWWRHEMHPKHYIGHLITRSSSTAYDETMQGAQALQTLNWKNVPKVETDSLFIRALFEDLADWFEVPSPIIGNTAPAFYPPASTRRANLTLRNL